MYTPHTKQKNINIIFARFQNTTKDIPFQ